MTSSRLCEGLVLDGLRLRVNLVPSATIARIEAKQAAAKRAAAGAVRPSAFAQPAKAR